MASLKQIEANRRNALKSTGPKTPEGKDAVRLNGLRHGLRARTILLPGERREEFEQLCRDLEEEWRPASRTEQFYLEQMAVTQWKLTRMEVGEADLFSEPHPAKAQIPLLDRLWQAQHRLERSYARAQHELERLQASRRAHVQTEVAPDSAPGAIAQAEPAPPPAPSPAYHPPSPYAQAQAPGNQRPLCYPEISKSAGTCQRSNSPANVPS